MVINGSTACQITKYPFIMAFVHCTSEFANGYGSFLVLNLWINDVELLMAAGLNVHVGHTHNNAWGAWVFMLSSF